MLYNVDKQFIAKLKLLLTGQMKLSKVFEVDKKKT